MKPLEELCLSFIAKHINEFSSRLGNFLSRKHKELLLERMCWHELFTDQLLPTISYHLFSDTLQRISFTDSEQINDKTMEILGLSNCQPVSLTIHKCPQVSDKGIEALSKLSFFIKMEYLNLTDMKHLTGEGFKRLGSKSVVHLELSGCNKVSDQGFIACITRCSNVKVLDISDMYKLTDKSIMVAAESLGSYLVRDKKSKEEIVCSDNALITCESTASLAKHCRNIRKASFEGCVKLDGSGLIQMAENCTLESLSVSFCYKLSPLSLDTLISTLNAKERLKSLELMAITFGDFTVEFLSSCHYLTHLFIAGASIKDDELEIICKSLKDRLIELDISGCQKLTDASCNSIGRHLKNLEFLGMRNMKDITGMGLSPMFQDSVRAANIKYISFSGSKSISPVVVRLIATNCSNIETLLLAGLKDITDDIIFSLALNCPNLTHCSLRNCQLTDMGVCELARCCQKLVMLALAGIHDLTDECIIALANHCPYMEELLVSGCAKITKQALTYLSDSVIKSLWIKHAVPNAPPGLLMAKDLNTGKYERMD